MLEMLSICAHVSMSSFKAFEKRQLPAGFGFLRAEPKSRAGKVD
jgi:hypothetical protein